jgi:hypothetical protein
VPHPQALSTKALQPPKPRGLCTGPRPATRPGLATDAIATSGLARSGIIVRGEMEQAPPCHEVRPFVTPRGVTTMASADVCPITADIAAIRAARVPVGSGGRSTPFGVALSPAPLATIVALGFGGNSPPFEVGLSPTPIVARAACWADLPE